jgi:threonine dehydratase
LNTTLEAPGLDEIRRSHERIRNTILRTPLIPLECDAGEPEIFLKLENLQPIGSFKLRGAGNAMQSADPDLLRKGVYTASAGNMAQGVAWNARNLGISCRVVVPDTAPKTKLDAIERLGADVIPVSYDEWWNVMTTHSFRDFDSYFVHPVCNPQVVAGNATVGLEIAEDLPDVAAIIVPYGGGGLSCGIAAAFRGMGKAIPVYAAEVETAAPFAAALTAGEPRRINRTPTFVDGIGAQSVLPEMWPMAQSLLAGSIVVSIRQIEKAIHRLAERQHVISEGAGGAALAAGLSGAAGWKNVVCVVSGGNIDFDVLAGIVELRTGEE